MSHCGACTMITKGRNKPCRNYSQCRRLPGTDMCYIHNKHQIITVQPIVQKKIIKQPPLKPYKLRPRKDEMKDDGNDEEETKAESKHSNNRRVTSDEILHLEGVSSYSQHVLPNNQSIEILGENHGFENHCNKPDGINPIQFIKKRIESLPRDEWMDFFVEWHYFRPGLKNIHLDYDMDQKNQILYELFDQHAFGDCLKFNVSNKPRKGCPYPNVRVHAVDIRGSTDDVLLWMHHAVQFFNNSVKTKIIDGKEIYTTSNNIDLGQLHELKTSMEDIFNRFGTVAGKTDYQATIQYSLNFALKYHKIQKQLDNIPSPEIKTIILDQFKNNLKNMKFSNDVGSDIYVHDYWTRKIVIDIFDGLLHAKLKDDKEEKQTPQRDRNTMIIPHELVILLHNTTLALLLFTSQLSDLYTITRMCRTFKQDNHKTVPLKNILFYGGDAHSKNLRHYLYAIYKTPYPLYTAQVTLQSGKTIHVGCLKHIGLQHD